MNFNRSIQSCHPERSEGPCGRSRGRHAETSRLLGVLAIVAGLVSAGCVNRAAQQQAAVTQKIVSNPVQPVVAAPVSLKNLTQVVEITGDVTTSHDVMVGAKNEGRLVDVYIQDGDPVRKGQVIAQQDTTNQRIVLQQDQAAVSNARSSLSQALANARIGPLKSSAAVLQAQAQLNQAQAALDKAVNGARPEEKAQADSNVASAKSSMDTARKQRDRQRQLLDQGAISQQDFDTAENAFETAVSAYQNAIEAQKMSRSQTRPEDIQAARDAVAQAREGLKTAQAQKQLDSLFRDQVDAARATLQGAQDQVRNAEQQIRDAQILAPFDGRVDGKPAQAGTVLSAGGIVAHVIGKAGVYFEGQVSENDISQVSQGSPVVVRIDSIPGKTFAGHVAAISPSASAVGRLFSARVQLDALSPDIKPGLFARGDVTVKTIPNATVVPTEALVQQEGQNFVFVVENGKAHLQKVSLGLQQGDFTEVHGVSSGQQVVTTGQNNLVEGTQVRVDTAQLASNVRGT